MRVFRAAHPSSAGILSRLVGRSNPPLAVERERAHACSSEWPMLHPAEDVLMRRESGCLRTHMDSSSRANPANIREPGAKLPSIHALVRAWFARRRRLLIALTISSALLAGLRLWRSGASEGSVEASFEATLLREGLRVSNHAILWLADDEGPWSLRPALFLAHHEGESNDVWYGEIRPGRGGSILDATTVVNLTETPGANEESLARVGEYAIFFSRAGEAIEAVTLFDLRGERDSGELTHVERVQHAITNLQETGRVAGFGRVRFQLRRPTTQLRSRLDGGRLTFAAAEGAGWSVDLTSLDITEGSDEVESQAHVAGVPGGITWIVDTVRNLSFVGPAPIEWLENRVFALQDAFHRARHAVLGSENAEEAALADLGVPRASEPLREERRALLTAREAELGWPPPPMTPVIADDPVSGEGEWIAVIEDPFVNHYPGAPAAFVQSFVRPDPLRPYVRVYVTMWDPRQVQLRMMPGTREPQSATGDLGAGRIPRDERTLRTLVGAFNGGFQAMHGEFGMMAEGRVYLPPKPWAATVAVFDDGRVGMGSWPAPNWRGRYFDENLANRQIPEGLVELRQNLTSVVEDGVWNPWERWWWGAAPQESDEQTYTYRSGLCLTNEGFFAFFWGDSLGPEALGQAMISARCQRAMHLDMNSGHCGFEFFRTYRAEESATIPSVARVHTQYEYDGQLSDAPGWRVRGRKAVRSMAMRFPRYLTRDPRDFFYLTLRPTLPGPPLAGAAPAEGEFSSVGLPHAGWPYAFARLRVGSTWLVRIDPRRAVPNAIREPRHERILAGFTGASGVPRAGAIALYARRQMIGWHFAIGVPSSEDRVLLEGHAEGGDAGAAIGVDRDGFLVYAEGAGLRDVLARAGVQEPMWLGDDVRLALLGEGGAAAPDGETARTLLPEPALAFMAEEAPVAEVLFPDNTPMPYNRWGYLQGQRVRYFPSQPPRFSREVEP